MPATAAPSAGKPRVGSRIPGRSKAFWGRAWPKLPKEVWSDKFPTAGGCGVSLPHTPQLVGGGPSPAPGLRLPARHGRLRKSLENEGIFDEIRPCFCKSLEINKTNSVLRVLYGVMSLCSLCNSWNFTPLGVHHHPAAAPAFFVPWPPGGRSRSPGPPKGGRD